jgi:hypothetical protein
VSQQINWRQPSGEFTNLLERSFPPTLMLVSRVFLETSMPNTASVIVALSCSHLKNKRSASIDLVHRTA